MSRGEADVFASSGMNFTSGAARVRRLTELERCVAGDTKSLLDRPLPSEAGRNRRPRSTKVQHFQPCPSALLLGRTQSARQRHAGIRWRAL